MVNSDSSPATTEEPTAELAGMPVAGVATELRRRRELLRWTQAEAARRSGVSRTVINEIEAGRRVPQTRTYEKLRGALGLSLPAAPALLRRPVPQSHTERQLATLAGCLLSGRGGSLAALAEAVEVSIPAVREQLSCLADRLAACGMVTVDDGDEVRLMVLPWAAEAIGRMTELEVEQALGAEAVEVLVIVGVIGSPTRREIEDRRGGEDCEGLLARMCRRGLLEKARDESLRGDPNIYRLTTVALGALGHATLESFRAWCAQQVSRGGTTAKDGTKSGESDAVRA